jgi:hypothetical protein
MTSISTTAVFLNLFYTRGLPLSLIYLLAPPPHPFVDIVTYKKKSSFIYTLLIYILEYVYFTFIYNTALFLNILFQYNTLFTYTSKNIPLIICIIFSVFLRPVNTFQFLNVRLQCGQW